MFGILQLYTPYRPSSSESALYIYIYIVHRTPGKTLVASRKYKPLNDTTLHSHRTMLSEKAVKEMKVKKIFNCNRFVIDEVRPITEHCLLIVVYNPTQLSSCVSFFYKNSPYPSFHCETSYWMFVDAVLNSFQKWCRVSSIEACITHNLVEAFVHCPANPIGAYSFIEKSPTETQTGLTNAFRGERVRTSPPFLVLLKIRWQLMLCILPAFSLFSCFFERFELEGTLLDCPFPFQSVLGGPLLLLASLFSPLSLLFSELCVLFSALDGM